MAFLSCAKRLATVNLWETVLVYQLFVLRRQERFGEDLEKVAVDFEGRRVAVGFCAVSECAARRWA